MAKVTPSLGLTGRYTCRPPYVLEPAMIYEVIAIRRFEDLLVLGQDVFADYYEPVGLLRTDYATDNREGASIVTFVDTNDRYVYIPDTYITSMPSQDNVPYQHLVVSLSLGPFPEYVDTSHLLATLKSAAEGIVGVVAEPQLHVAPVRNSISAAEHEGLEVARTNKITDQATERQRRIEAERKLNAALAEIAALQQALIDAGLVTDVPG